MLTMEINRRCIIQNVNQKRECKYVILIFQTSQSIFLKTKSCTKKCIFSNYFGTYYSLIDCTVIFKLV